MAAQGVEVAPDHPEVGHGARHGSDSHHAVRGDCGDAGSFSDATPVVELLRPGDRDPVFGGLGSGQESEVGAFSGVFKGAATTVIAQLRDDALHGDYERMLQSGIKPSLAKLTVARKIAAMVLSMWKHQEVYDPKRRQPLPDQP
jgi:hypothetical protein